MRVLFVSLTLLHCLVPVISLDCDTVCWFAFDNRDGTLDDQGEMWVQTDETEPTGLITVVGSFDEDSEETYDTLRFQNYNTSAEFEPLIFKLQFDTQTSLNVYGQKGGVGSPTYMQAFVDISNTGDFEIKFTTLTTGKMTIQYKDSYNTNALSMGFNYNDNWAAWGPSTDYAYSNTNRIFSQLKRTKYKYIHICQVESATVCDNGEEDAVPAYDLEQEIVLNCTAVGPAPLTVEWSADVSNDAITAVIDGANTTWDEDTGAVLTSLLTISELTLDHLAKYTCEVESNGESALSDFEVYTVDFTRAISVAFVSEQDYFTADVTGETFSWKVTGWPLADVTLTTSLDPEEDEESNSTEDEDEKDYELTRGENYDEVPPTVSLTITFNTTISGDSFTVFFIDDEGGKNETVYTATITRVGVGCIAGEYGVGLGCVQCATGYTSPAGADASDDCFAASSTCVAGYYGIDDDCTACPDGQTSDAESLHLVDCFEDPDAEENTDTNTGDEDSSNLPVIIGAVIGGVFLVIVIIAALICVKRRQSSPTSGPEEGRASEGVSQQQASARAPANPSSQDSVVVTNRAAGEEGALPPIDEDLYDNSKLKNTPSTKKPKKIDDHITSLDSSIQALDDIKIDGEPAYVELDKEHFDKIKKDKADKKKKKRSTKKDKTGDPEAERPTVTFNENHERTTEI